ncbi:aryl-sulfate sulfotransferase, partial [Shewanella sp. GXUN23E]|uniref:aryl-sulfate sulfotransferase N-terminal domain-containing protein n=1 Tax=Shewanella sp. GXUN23E TaxID=3422498 RepID=UPI003D7D4E4A
MLKKLLIATAVSSVLLSGAATASLTGMKPSNLPNQPLGYIIHDPYDNAPLTAVVTLSSASQEISDVKVSIKPKKGGAKLDYEVADNRIKDEGGVPIFGLYPDHMNEFTVTFKEGGKTKSHTYSLLTPDVATSFDADQWAKHPLVNVKKVDKEFKDRLYFINWTSDNTKNGILTHNTPGAHGAFSWDGMPGFYIIDTAGDIRWYMDAKKTHDSKSYEKAGYAMGMNVTDDGNMVWVQGQGWKHMTIMGRMISEHSLPGFYAD